MANPTWTRTNSPRAMSGMQARQTSRVMPPNWTLPTFRPCSSRISRTSPGMPRHIIAPLHLPRTPCRHRRLSQGHAAVVGRHAAVDEDGELVLLEEALGGLAQQPVLEAAAGERHRLHPRSLARDPAA